MNNYYRQYLTSKQKVNVSGACAALKTGNMVTIRQLVGLDDWFKFPIVYETQSLREMLAAAIESGNVKCVNYAIDELFFPVTNEYYFSHFNLALIAGSRAIAEKIYKHSEHTELEKLLQESFDKKRWLHQPGTAPNFLLKAVMSQIDSIENVEFLEEAKLIQVEKMPQELKDEILRRVNASQNLSMLKKLFAIGVTPTKQGEYNSIVYCHPLLHVVEKKWAEGLQLYCKQLNPLEELQIKQHMWAPGSDSPRRLQSYSETQFLSLIWEHASTVMRVVLEKYMLPATISELKNPPLTQEQKQFETRKEEGAKKLAEEKEIAQVFNSAFAASRGDGKKLFDFLRKKLDAVQVLSVAKDFDNLVKGLSPADASIANRSPSLKIAIDKELAKQAKSATSETQAVGSSSPRLFARPNFPVPSWPSLVMSKSPKPKK
jgi:hypothetical protein